MFGILPGKGGGLLEVIFRVFHFLGVFHQVACICDGHWGARASHQRVVENFGDAGLGYLAANDTSLLCAADTFMHSCFFHQTFARASSLLNRVWVTNSSNCVDFSPLLFLKRLENRTLFLVGDSTTMQVFQSFVCSVIPVTRVNLDIGWHFEDVNGHYRDKKVCPLGAHHCHILRGQASFPSFNSRMTFRWLSQYDKSGLIRSLLVDSKREDFVVINFGLHTNDLAAFKAQLTLMREDFLEQRAVRKFPTYFFRESFPTHFSTHSPLSGYGYYSSNVSGKRCVPYPLSNESDIYLSDWRNNLLPVFLNATDIRLIPLARALYSQFDAHVDGDSKTIYFPFADCTHYCAQSAIFSYVKLIILNHLLAP